MKTIKLLLLVPFVVSFFSCEKIEISNDPILGYWEIEQEISLTGKAPVKRMEQWVFNDIYLGRYNVFENDVLVYHKDYDWEVDPNGLYTISYRGESHLVDFKAILSFEENELLKNMDGQVIAKRR